MTSVRFACTFALLVALAASAHAQKSAPKAAHASLQATLEKLETDGWETFKNKDAKGYSALCAPDYTGVFADGKAPHDLKSAIDAMNGMTVNSYHLHDLQVTALGPDAALVTYTAIANITSGGKTQDYKLAVSDVWVKRGGQWRAQRYHESALQ